MKWITKAIVVLSVVLSGCASLQNQEETHTFYGKVVNVRPYVAQESEANGTGAVVGGVAGGVVGNQFGKGNGKTAMTVLGVLGGATIGSQVNKKVVNVAMTELTIQMPNGSSFNVSVKDSGFMVGQTVEIIQKGRTAEIKAM